jgi:hypothetical protein
MLRLSGAVVIGIVCAGPAVSETIRFDDMRVGTLPIGWMIALTGPGAQPRWEILQDETAPSRPNVFAQVSADKTTSRFPLAVLDQPLIHNGDLAVKFRAISGTVDQAAGLVWRYRDSRNYYLVRTNALENNVVLYKVQEGKRTSIAPVGEPANTYGVRRAVSGNTWHQLRVSFEERRFKVWFDGDALFEVEDSTFTGEGRIGLWTKADSITYFDDFTYSGR